MKTKVKRFFAAALVAIALLSSAPMSGMADFDRGSLFATKAAAATEVYYTYSVSDGEATITDVDTTISGDIEIPSTLGGYPVTSIDDWAFEACTDLTSITIPDSVTSIGEYAFRGCTGLTSITIGNSVTSIGEDAFNNTGYYNDESNWKNDVLYIGNYLIKVKDTISGADAIKDGTKTIADDAFSWCDGLTRITIPDSVTSIGDLAFYSCSGLTSIIIPDSVTSIGEHAFYGCTDLTSIKVDEENPVYDSRNNCNAIIETETNTLIQGCKNTVIPDNVTSIGDWAFYVCFGLTSITIPDSVTSIGDRAFSYCDDLTSITIPDSVTSIGEDAFSNCTGLTSITIPDSVTSIGYDAFSYCRNLASITIGNGVTSIGSSAFFYCSNLTSITIPDSVTSIGSWAFKNTGYYNDESNWKNDVLYIGNHLIEAKVTISGAYEIKEGTKTIAEDAFSGCTGLTSITIGNSVTSIGEYAFYGCDSLADVYYYGEESDWKNITIDSGNYCLTNAKIHFIKKITGLTLNKNTLQLEPNNATKLIATITPETSTDIVWSSSDTSVATVENGVVWAVSEGVAVITATLVDDSKSATCTVTVREKPEDFKLDTQDASISVNDTIKLNGIFTPDDISDKSISWKSYDESVATVDENGLVTGHKAGTTVIIATAQNGGLKDFCLVKVVGITASSKLTTIDSENGLIYGITPGSATLNDFVTLGASDYTLEYDNKFEKVGTGSVVNLICDDSVADSYTVVVFGDVDGDGWYDGQDAVMVSMLAGGMLTREQVGEAVYMAADCNHDGVIDQADIDLLNQAGALLSNVNQTLSTEEMLETAAYKEYFELIDQALTIDEAEDNSTEKTPTEENPTANVLWTTIVAFLEKILSFIISLFKIA